MSQIVKADLTEWAMDCWAVGQLVDWAAGKDGDKQTKAMLRNQVTEVAAELAGPNPTFIERLLAETAAIAWFDHRHAEGKHAAGAIEGITLAQSDHGQRRIDRAHRRLLSTLRTLATVRRLAVPALQINLAHQQQIAQLNTVGTS